jgi:hypothetical protein
MDDLKGGKPKRILRRSVCMVQKKSVHILAADEWIN